MGYHRAGFGVVGAAPYRVSSRVGRAVNAATSEARREARLRLRAARSIVVAMDDERWPHKASEMRQAARLLERAAEWQEKAEGGAGGKGA